MAQKRGPKGPHDPELLAMRRIARAMGELDPEAANRLAIWVASRWLIRRDRQPSPPSLGSTVTRTQEDR